jgi:hypothetical protein
MAKPQIDLFRGAVVVRREVVTRGNVRGYLVSWRKPIPQSLMLPTEDLSTQFAERLAAGQNPINILADVLNAKRRAKIGSNAGKAAWSGMTPEQRSAEMTRRALKRWRGDGAAPAAVIGDGQ